MLSYHALSMNEKETITALVRALDMKNSEMNFASMYMWKDAYETTVAIAGDTVHILERRPLDAELAHIQPPLTTGPLKEPLTRAIEDMKARGLPFMMRSIDEAYRERMEAEMPDVFDFTLDRDFFDYVYPTEKLVSLSGNAYHQKRNHINKFRSIYQSEFVELFESDVDACLAVLDKWTSDKGAGDARAAELERGAVFNALTNLSALGLRCGALRVDGRIEAFSIGEKIGDTAFIHIEKANTDISGLFSVINQQMLENLFPDTVYVNREEDMGIPGLRQAKSSYRPCHYVEKYFARLKEEVT